MRQTLQSQKSKTSSLSNLSRATGLRFDKNELEQQF